MLGKLSVFALIVSIWGCGGKEEQRELISYVNQMKQFDDENKNITKYVEMMDHPSVEVTAADLEAARQLIESYLALVDRIEGINYRELRVTHDLYVRKLSEARQLAADTGREMRRERGNVAIAVRHIEKMTKQHYNTIDVLWLRQDVKEPFPLKWP